MSKDQILIRKIGIYLDMGQGIVLTRDSQKDVDRIIDAAVEGKMDAHKIIKIDMLKMTTLQDISDSIVYQINTFLNEHDKVEEFYDKKDDYGYLCHALELPEKISKTINTKMIFIINELEYAANFDTDFKILEIMRSIFQHQHNVIYVFTGTSKTLIRNVFHDRHAPFFRFATEVG